MPMRNCDTSTAPSTHGCLGSQTPHSYSIDSFPTAMTVAIIAAGTMGMNRAASSVRNPPHPMCARTAVLIVMVPLVSAADLDADYERPKGGGKFQSELL